MGCKNSSPKATGISDKNKPGGIVPEGRIPVKTKNARSKPTLKDEYAWKNPRFDNIWTATDPDDNAED